MNHASPSIFRPLRAILAATAFLLAALCPEVSRAMLVSLTLTYSSTDATSLYGNYKLKEGSIVQVIAYTTPGASQPTPVSAENYFEQYGNISSDDPAYPPSIDSGVFLADSAPENHYIVYTGTLTKLDNGQYGIVTDFTMDDSFNALYVRVFEATDFPQGRVVLSYWGVSAAETGINPTLGHYSYNVSDTAANLHNYFEVIPEPATLSLFALGTVALAVFRRNRNSKGKGVRS